MDESWSKVLGSGGVGLSVRDVTDGGQAGRPLLLLHGLASSQRIWDLALPRLAKHHRVVSFDARGHGLSGKPSSGYGFETVARDALAVIRAMRLGRPVVVGHSWGAMVALELAAREPHSVAGIVMVDGGVFRMRDDFAAWPDAREKLTPPPLAGTPVAEFRRRIRRYLGESMEVSEQVEDIVLSVMRVDPRGAIHPRLSRANHFRILHAIWRQDPAALYDRLRVPALAILARNDGHFADAKHRAAERLRGSSIRVTWMRGIHDLPLQHPAALALHIHRSAQGVGG